MGVKGYPKRSNLPICKVYNTYEKAQYIRETGHYPMRCDKCRALFGDISNLLTIMPFYSGEVAPDLRGRSVRVTDFCIRGERRPK
jgi:hypothetical protein